MIRPTGGLVKPALFGLAGLLALLIVGALVAPMLLFAGGGLLYSTGSTCSSGPTTTSQPQVSTAASNSIPANYLTLFKSIGARYKVPWADIKATLKNVKMEVELGFDVATAWKEAQRCLNCDVQTVFTDRLCIECDACVDICPMDCITFTENGEEKDLRSRLNAPALNPTQDLYIGNSLKTGRIMAKDEDVCLHCGLCAERCPTGAWDMQRFLLDMAQVGAQAGHACRSR